MARRRSFVPLLLVAAVALAIGGVAWFALLDSGPATPLAPTATKEVAAATPRPAEPSAVAPDVAAPRASNAELAPAANERAVATEGEDAELAQAIWVEGRVRFPDGTPVGEKVEVVADGKKFEHRDEYRMQVAADGRFRVAFSKETKSGWLKLDAPHLYLDPLKLKLAALPDAITLEPQVGGEITGVIVPPAGATDVAAVLKKTNVQLSGWGGRNSRDQVSRASTIDENLRFDLRGIPTHLKYHLSVDAEAWAQLMRSDLRVEAGATQELELALTLGARISGHIVDASDKPVGGVTLRAEITDDVGSRSDFHVREGKVDKNGSFAVRGIDPGKVALVANKDGYVEARVDMGALADGDVRDDFVLRLDSGNFVAGRVTWPDGALAAGAYVRVVEPKSEHENQRYFVMDENQSTKVDAGGNFRVSGLRPGPYEVWAQARDGLRPETGADGQPVKKFRASGQLWRAHAAAVSSGTAELVLVLQPGLVVAGRVTDEARAPVTSFSVVATEAADDSYRFSRNADTVNSKFEAADGRFELQGLKDGSWTLVVRAKGFNSNEPAVVRVPGDGSEIELTITHCARLAGVVVDASGKPVVKATVTAATERRDYARMVIGGEPTASTNERGEFVFDDAPSGKVKLSASHPGFAESRPMSLTVAAAQHIEGLSVVLTNGGAIRGELHASLGAELNGWDISLMSREDSGWQHTSSDAAGSFAFERVTPGSYTVQAQPPDDGDAQVVGTVAVAARAAAFKRRPSATVNVTDGQTAHVVLGAPASAPIRVSGRVLVAGTPATDVAIYAWQKEQQLSAHTGADGRYELVVDGAGEYSFNASRDSGGTQISRHVTIPETQSYTLDFELDSGRIAGRVLDADGAPLEDAIVQLKVDAAQAELSSTGVHGWNQTKADGAFDFDGLSPGTYQITVNDMAALRGGISKHGLAHVDDLRLEDGGSIQGLEIRLKEAAFIEGLVRTSSGAPAIGAHISVRDERGQMQSNWWRAASDGAGHFRVDGLAPGTWSVSAQLDREVSDESEPVHLESGSTATVDLDLRIGTMLRVVVEDADGKVVGAALSVRDAHGLEHASAFYVPQSSEASSAGRSIGPLAPGKYEVTATNHDGVHASESVSLNGQSEQAVRLRLGGS
jgi:protocatechuate 3,4-dioxygenase beta subunit